MTAGQGRHGQFGPAPGPRMGTPQERNAIRRPGGVTGRMEGGIMHDDRAVLIHRETGRRIGPAQRWLATASSLLRSIRVVVVAFCRPMPGPTTFPPDKGVDLSDEAQQRRADAAIAQLRGGNTTE
jgi:hypothetical protein